MPPVSPGRVAQLQSSQLSQRATSKPHPKADCFCLFNQPHGILQWHQQAIPPACVAPPSHLQNGLADGTAGTKRSLCAQYNAYFSR